MESQETIIYVGIVLATGISMIVASQIEKFKSLYAFKTLKISLKYLLLIFFLTIFQWAFGGSIYFLINLLF
tara:strand:+ start:318 stop:530 length:213 start_codon:yes stop_codon:yes gene_type:complete